MRVLLLYAHPLATSFNAALHRASLEALQAAGHEVDDCDLYAEGFQAAMSGPERAAYHDLEHNQDTVADYVARLQKADALAMVFPVWNYGYPAILKGFFDRVFLPGVSFELLNGRVAGKLHNISKVMTVATYGGPRWAALLAGDPPRRVVKRVLRMVVRPGASFTYLAQYQMNLASLATREKFLARVRQAMAGL
jgi:NAD(P)H dehydrogenase (quinone)